MRLVIVCMMSVLLRLMMRRLRHKLALHINEMTLQSFQIRRKFAHFDRIFVGRRQIERRLLGHHTEAAARRYAHQFLVFQRLGVLANHHLDDLGQMHGARAMVPFLWFLFPVQAVIVNQHIAFVVHSLLFMLDELDSFLARTHHMVHKLLIIQLQHFDILRADILLTVGLLIAGDTSPNLRQFLSGHQHTQSLLQFVNRRNGRNIDGNLQFQQSRVHANGAKMRHLVHQHLQMMLVGHQPQLVVG
mmetsp:Transcript_62958/g.99986  ORF Transcript_62958/g.99986 Transcript_62958/m.99986 type:complete len:245 (-) Transcript_62958:229-963(-)